MSDEVEIQEKEQSPELWMDIAYEMALRKRPRPQPKLKLIEGEYHDTGGRQRKPRKKVIEYDREPTVSWVAEKYNLTVKQAMAVILNPKFTKFLHAAATAIAKTDFNLKAFDILDEVMETGMDKHKLAAIKLAAELLGYKQPTGGLNVNFNFDSAIRKADSDDGNTIDTEAFPGF